MSTNTEVIVIPDGKWVIPREIYNLTDVHMRTRTCTDECVRLTVENGKLTQFNDASHRFYTLNREGQRLTEGFEWITSVEQIISLASCLPYGWREG